MVFKHSYVVPIMIPIWFNSTFVITYIIAILNGNVAPVFPYISDSGTHPPESCIFDILLTTGAIFYASLVYIRYRQLKELYSKHNIKPCVQKLNIFTMYLGFISSYGIVIVGCFQEKIMFTVHMIGALMAFGGAMLYEILQVIVSFLIYPEMGNYCVNIFRACCAALTVATFGIAGGFAVASFLEFKGEDITKWQREHGGYDFHLISTTAEWAMAILVQFYMASFTKEFRAIQFTEPGISLMLD